jgi:hypothetical protein
MKKRASASGALSSAPYLRSLARQLTSRTTEFTEPLADWALKRIRLDGRRFSFQGHEYLRGLYDDTARHVVLTKAAQVGGTTWALLETFHACLSGLNVIYFFPTRSDVLEFSKSRVGPLLAENAFLETMMTDTDTAGLKRIGNAHLYLRGMKSSVGMKSVQADVVVFDELDESTPQAKAMAKERLAHSRTKRIIELSNPSLPDYGVDEAFQKSDQRHWTLKCPGCGSWVALDKLFPRKLGQTVEIIRERSDGSHFWACPKCSAELDMARGEWVADFPKRTIHGYRISQLLSSTVDPGEILEEYETTRFPELFFNLKIGIPWADTNRRLDPSTVLALCSDEPMLDSSDSHCSMGIDTGKQFHVVVLRDDEDSDEKQHLVYLATCRSFSELDDLMKRFRVDRCVIDGGPDIHSTRAFVARHTPFAYLCFFNEHQRTKPHFNSRERQVLVNRTEALDASRAAVRNKLLVLPRREEILDTFAEHMAADAKMLKEDEKTGECSYRYERTGPRNDFSMAFTYAWLAATDWSGSRGLYKYALKQLKKQGLR